MSGTIQQHPAIAALNRLHPQQTAAYDPEKGYTGQYNTPLTPQEEAQFQEWGRQQEAKTGRNPARDVFDYDMRGAWKSGMQQSGNDHWGDKFKKPNHPTFSDLSLYSTPEMPGGQWAQQPDGSWSFAPTQHNLQMTPPDKLQDYFQKKEPGNRLIMPQTGGTPMSSKSVPPEYLPFYQEASRRTGIPMATLIAQAQQESSFNPNAVGSAGEIGLHQIKPSTAANPGYGVAAIDPAMLRDPRTNILFAADYLKGRAGFGANFADKAVMDKALAAYNGGGDPRYVEHVNQHMPAATPTLAAGPTPTPTATPAPTSPAKPSPAKGDGKDVTEDIG